jgi:hypothetical protein
LLLILIGCGLFPYEGSNWWGFFLWSFTDEFWGESGESLFEMWLQRPLSIREVVWQLEDISGIYAYESYCSSVSSDSGSTFTMVKNWTEDDYIFPFDTSKYSWVEYKIVGVPSCYSYDTSILRVCLVWRFWRGEKGRWYLIFFMFGSIF